VILAAATLLVILIEFSTLPRPYPANPTVGSVPVDPELLVPALLGLVAVVGALREGSVRGRSQWASSAW
jgi:hypothetical protein